MTSDIPDLNFGPSERYLPGKKLVEGDVLTFNILDIEFEEVDTDFGSKFQFHLNILSSSTDAVKLGEYVWRTVASAPRKVHKYYMENISATSDFRLNFMHWVWKLTVMENGVRMETLNSGSDLSGGTIKHGIHVPGNIIAGAGE